MSRTSVLGNRLALGAAPGLFPGLFLGVSLGLTPSAFAADQHGELLSNSHGEFPVRWNQKEIQGLNSIGRCDALMRTFEPIAEMDHVLEMKKDDPTKPDEKWPSLVTHAHTCAEWHRALDDGYHAFTTLEMNMESWFIHSSAMFTGLPAMQPSLRSGFENDCATLDLASLARDILAPSIDTYEIKFRASPKDLSKSVQLTTSADESTGELARNDFVAQMEKREALRAQFELEIEKVASQNEMLQGAGFARDELELLNETIYSPLKSRLNWVGNTGELVRILEDLETQRGSQLIDNDDWRKSEKAMEALERGCVECWQLQDGVALSHEYFDIYEWASLLARGDYDGDGWEDLLFEYGFALTEGTMRSFSAPLYTRRGNGRLVDISHRFINKPDWRQKLPSLQAWWANNCGIPADQWFALHGTCDCRGEDDLSNRFTAKHGLHMRVKFEHGYLQGTYHCDRVGRRMEIVGALGIPLDPRVLKDDSTDTEEMKRRASRVGPRRTHDGMIDEYGIPDMHTAQIKFEWGYLDGVFALSGYRVGNTHFEIDYVELVGRAEENCSAQ